MRNSDIWGRCPSCARWFPCPEWFHREREHPTCPTCGTEPTRIENRAATPSVARQHVTQCREDLRESIGNALSYTHQLCGLSRALTGPSPAVSVAEQLTELEAGLEAELRRAAQIASELERLGRAPFTTSDAALSAAG